MKPFFLVRGTGKTVSIIGAMKEFVGYIVCKSGNSSIHDIIIVLAPTNLAALAIRGQIGQGYI